MRGSSTASACAWAFQNWSPAATAMRGIHLVSRSPFCQQPESYQGEFSKQTQLFVELGRVTGQRISFVV